MQDGSGGLRRELGSLASYATLIGILVGAGIFRVTSDASAATGPSVILAHVALAPAVLASSVAYAVFLSTSLGLEPGGEAAHIARTFASPLLGFVCAWLKIVSYLGAGAYLAGALADNVLELAGITGAAAHRAIATAGLLAFTLVHAAGVRWFARLQVGMCTLLALALGVLILPGLAAIDPAHYHPFFTGGASGFAAALPPLFFAYAGFEALAHAAGEVTDSRRRLPAVFLRGIAATTVIFIAMSAVAFGALPAGELEASTVPMTTAAARYLPFGAVLVVTTGAILAIATSLNASLIVPARLAWSLAREGLLPHAFGTVHAEHRTPVFGLAASFAAMALLVLSGQTAMALGIAVVALMLLYGLHSLALLALPRRAPELYSEVRSALPRSLQVTAALVSVLSMGVLVGVQLRNDAGAMLETSFSERLRAGGLTSLELLGAWGFLGLVVYTVQRGSSGSTRP